MQTSIGLDHTCMGRTGPYLHGQLLLAIDIRLGAALGFGVLH